MNKIKDNIYLVGVKHEKRRLFDSLVYMPQGTSYNSYFVEGEKYNALIDCSDPETKDEFIANIKSLGKKKIDYIILLHAEQDHSGATKDIKKLYPDAQIICTDKVKQLMQVHFEMDDDEFMVKNSGDELDLGGMQFEFHPIPFAHWPDNTMLFLKPLNVLFSSDLFGAHHTMDDYAQEMTESICQSTRKYYSEIMMPFRKNIAKHVSRTKEINPEIIAPAHGPVWLKPSVVIEKYEEWTSDKVIPFVTIPYVSMHDSTKIAVEFFASRLEKLGIKVSLRNLAQKPESLMIETGELVYDLVDASGVVFAFPTVIGGPHPAILYAAMTANAMNPKAIAIGMLCSYGWASKATDVLSSVIPNFKGEKLTPLMFKGLPKGEDYKKLEEYADDVANIILSRS